MTQPRQFRFDRRRGRIAQLLADGVLTEEEIADMVMVSRATISRLKRNVDFMARVEALVEDAAEKLRARGLLLRENRLAALAQRAKLMESVIEARASDSRYTDEPGYETGLLVHQVKAVGRGDDFQLIDLFMVDTGLLSELRATEKQAAQELGEWTEKREVAGKNGGPIRLLWDDGTDA